LESAASPAGLVGIFTVRTRVLRHERDKADDEDHERNS
jgi:hypothetical protein